MAAMLKKRRTPIAISVVAVMLLLLGGSVMYASYGASDRLNVAIVVVDGAEILDFTGPGEVFAAASALADKPRFNVYTVGVTGKPILSQGVFQITPSYSIKNSPAPDIIVIPGGGLTNMTGNKPFMEWFINASQHAKIVLSVCTGAMVLAEANMLDGLDATTWHDAIERLRKAAPRATVHENTRFVDTGKVITTAGVSAGIDGALHVVARLLGEEAARGTARYMEYDKWDPDAGLIAPAK